MELYRSLRTDYRDRCAMTILPGLRHLAIWPRNLLVRVRSGMRSEGPCFAHLFVERRRQGDRRPATCRKALVMHRAAPGRIRRKLPEPNLVVLLGRLAVTRSHLGRGIARALVRDAVLRTLQAAGIGALLVHSPDEDAAAFLWRLGFVESPIDPLVLMLPLATARSALQCRQWALGKAETAAGGTLPAPVDRRGVKHLVDRHQDATFRGSLGGQQSIPWIAVRPSVVGSLLGMVVGDG